MTSNVKTKTEREDKLYAKEPWAQLAVKAGYRPYDTESSARRAFEFCAEEIDELQYQLESLRLENVLLNEMTKENLKSKGWWMWPVAIFGLLIWAVLAAALVL